MGQNNDSANDRDARLEKLEFALGKAQAKLADQSSRLAALGAGREESIRELHEVRAELAVVTAERDQLQRQLLAMEGMQTETVALPDDQDEGPDAQAALPSIDELMSNLNSMLDGGQAQGRGCRLSGQAAETPDADWNEMIPPEVIAPEEFEGQAQRGGEAEEAQTASLLVYMDAERPIKYPLDKDFITIGRSEFADIRIDGESISRIHARIVRGEDGAVIEDTGSKNGLQINSVPARRHNLTHGDVIAIGKLRLTFLDIAQRAEPLGRVPPPENPDSD